MEIIFDRVLAEVILANFSVSYSEGYSEIKYHMDINAHERKEQELLNFIKVEFPDLADEYKHLYYK